MGLFTTSDDNIPNAKVLAALQRGVAKNLLFCVGGGIGDQLCAEPTLRYALKHFTDCKISIYARHPELFLHLPFDQVFKVGEDEPDVSKFLTLLTYQKPDSFSSQFFTACVMHCVDYCSLSALRIQLPIADRQIQSPSIFNLDLKMLLGSDIENPVFIHAGKTWPSRTPPAEWWNKVVAEILVFGGTPVFIGTMKETVDVKRCGVDLRDQLHVHQTLSLLKSAPVLLTNDSAPLHMAAIGDAFIGFLATAKHPDFITHWRRKGFGWRMKNFTGGNVHDLYSFCPNRGDTLELYELPEGTMEKWLPLPSQIGFWAVQHSHRFRESDNNDY